MTFKVLGSKRLWSIWGAIQTFSRRDWRKYRMIFLVNFLNFLGWDETESTWYVSHYLAYCTSLRWWWWWWAWSSRWNENWHGKPKYSEKTCPLSLCGRGGKPATNRLSCGAAPWTTSEQLVYWTVFRTEHLTKTSTERTGLLDLVLQIDKWKG
jgi:hypothetical protein